MTTEHAIVVGASAAGLAAADGLREGGFPGRITVLGAELHMPYDRPMLSKSVLAGKADTPPVVMRTREQLADRSIDLQLGHAAMGLDIDRRMVVTNYGEALPYDHVVIATGTTARPVRTTDGAALATLRTLDDLTVAREMADSGHPMTLIGAGFIGLEVAAALRSRDIPATLLGSGRTPLRRFVGDAVSTWLHDLHRANGVELDLSSRVVAVESTTDGFEVVLADGRRRRASAVLAGIGAEPCTDWLIGSGLDLECGVVIDAAGRTSVPSVWAAGDVASTLDPETGRRRRFEHWTHAIEQGRHVGLNIARDQAIPFSTVPYLWTEQYGMKLHLLGERKEGDTDVLVEGELASNEFVVAHGTGTELHAVTVCGRIRALRTYKKLLRAGATLDDAIGAAAPA